MKVVCIQNNFQYIDKNIYQNLGFDSDTVLPIEIGQQSIVYAITTIKNNFWYLVDVVGLRYPMYYPYQCFNIVDKRMSKYWQITELPDEYNDNKLGIFIGFNEMINDEYFYGELLEDNQNIIEIFNNYRKKMIEEF